jgi:uncharacterized membrane protein YjjB (DUF3815 family)
MVTTSAMLAAFLAIGCFTRRFSRRTRLLMLGAVLAGIVLLMRGQ